jgi:hypothetical protein
MMSIEETGNIEFEREPSKLDPKLNPDKRKSTDQPLPKREHYSESEAQEEGENREAVPGKSQLANRQTGDDPEFEREAQPVVSHQDRRHK